jgi:hypothetical protein
VARLYPQALGTDLIPATGCRYIVRTDPTENTACIVEEAYLPLDCLAIDVLLLSVTVCWGRMFTGPLPSNEL